MANQMKIVQIRSVLVDHEVNDIGDIAANISSRCGWFQIIVVVRHLTPIDGWPRERESCKISQTKLLVQCRFDNYIESLVVDGFTYDIHILVVGEISVLHHLHHVAPEAGESVRVRVSEKTAWVCKCMNFTYSSIRELRSLLALDYQTSRWDWTFHGSLTR